MQKYVKILAINILGITLLMHILEFLTPIQEVDKKKKVLIPILLILPNRHGQCEPMWVRGLLQY